MPAPTLSDMVRRACIKQVNTITDIGDMGYDLARPFLVKIQNPKQLWEIEKTSPQILGHDAELWKELCKRDIPNYEKDPQEPKNPQSWYKLYLKLKKADQQEVDRDAALLKAKLDGIKNNQAQNTAKQVELRGMSLTSGMRTDLPQIQMPRSSGVYRKERSTQLDDSIRRWERENGDVPADRQHQIERHRQAAARLTPASSRLMDKLRKDTRASSRFAGNARKGVIPPRDMRTKMPQTKTTLVKAPRHMIDSHKNNIPAGPASPTILGQQNRKRPFEAVDNDDPVSPSLEVREKRLKALQNNSKGTVTAISRISDHSTSQQKQASPPRAVATTSRTPTNPRNLQASSLDMPKSDLQRTSPQPAAIRRSRALVNPMRVPIRRRSRDENKV